MAIKIENKIVGYSVKKPEDTEQPKEAEPVKEQPKLKRPDMLESRTYKIRNMAEGYNLYIIIGYHEGKPFEIFFDSSHQEHTQWVKALARLSSAMLRNSEFSLEFLAGELMMIHSSDGYMTQGGEFKFVKGIVQHIGKLLMKIAKESAPTKPISTSVDEAQTSGSLKQEIEETGQECPECSSDMQLMDGCWSCPSCGWSKCS